MITAVANSDGTVDLNGKQGTTWSLGITFYRDSLRTEPLDLTGKQLRGQYRKDYKVTSLSLIDFVLTVDDLDSAENPDGNKAALFVSPSASSSVTVLSGVYDIELYSPEDPLIVERIMQGRLIISPEVTK